MDALAIIALETILLIASLIVLFTRERDHKADRAYDATTINSLKDQLAQARRNDKRDAKGRYAKG